MNILSWKNAKPACNAKSYGLTPQQKNEIVNMHNTYRQNVASGNEKRGKPGPQPRANNMPNLVSYDAKIINIS